jgi:hypothetical protein
MRVIRKKLALAARLGLYVNARSSFGGLAA